MSNFDKELTDKIRARLRAGQAVVADFPQPGVQFVDVFSLLCDPDLADGLEDLFFRLFSPDEYDVIVSPESRGFPLGFALAREHHKMFLPARKPGKLAPRGTLIQAQYKCEYGTGTIQLQAADIPEGSRILVVDDLLATGGTVRAVVNMIENCGRNCTVVGVAVVNELGFLQRDEFPPECQIRSVLYYETPPAANCERCDTSQLTGY